MGIGIARRTTAGVVQRERAVKVYVHRKRPLAAVDRPVPPVLAVPGVGAVPTDVVELGRVRMQMGVATTIRPLCPGASIGLAGADELGSTGPIVRVKGATSKRFVLSACHVLAARGVSDKGRVVCQPGRSHASSNHVGVLTHLRPLDPDATNVIDAAVARLSVPVSTVPRGLNKTPARVESRITEGQTVRISGCASLGATGRVVDTHWFGDVWMRTPGGNRRYAFDKLVLCTSFTQDGDSGGSIVNSHGNLVGLHIGGSDPTSASQGGSLFCRASLVFDELDLRLAFG